MIGHGPAMRRVIDLARRASRSQTTLILLGESGTGKKFTARHIHQLSGEAGQWVELDCGLADVQSFSDALRQAERGTLLLKDIQRAEYGVQSRLSQELQQSQTCSIDSETACAPRLRILATTCCELSDLLDQRLLRPDLFWLLNSATLRLPPLRERTEDIPILAREFLQRSCRVHDREDSVTLGADAIERMQEYSWPGNLHQLQSFLHTAVALFDSSHVDAAMFDDCLQMQSLHSARSEVPRSPVTRTPFSTEMDWMGIIKNLVRQGIKEADAAREQLHAFVVNHVEKELIAQILDECEQIQIKAAARLGINRNTLHKKVKDYELDKLR
jgi:DNA-binding NtrC family response regulator